MINLYGLHCLHLWSRSSGPHDLWDLFLALTLYDWLIKPSVLLLFTHSEEEFTSFFRNLINLSPLWETHLLLGILVNLFFIGAYLSATPNNKSIDPKLQQHLCRAHPWWRFSPQATGRSRIWSWELWLHSTRPSAPQSGAALTCWPVKVRIQASSSQCPSVPSTILMSSPTHVALTLCSHSPHYHATFHLTW